MCQRASHRASHRRWKNRKGNRDYCRSEAKKRVQNWRERHAGYWKKKALGCDGEAKAKLAKEQPVDRQEDKVEQRSRNATKDRGGTLRDFDMLEEPVIVGLIAMLTGGTLRDDIAATMDKMVIQGRNILGHEASG